MALRPIAVKLTQAEKFVGASTKFYLRRVFRYCYAAPLSPAEIADGLGITGRTARSALSAACKALTKSGALQFEDGRYIVDQDEVKRAKALTSLLK